MSLSQNKVCRRLSSLGVNQGTVHQILNLISLWKRSEGIEHTINRLKQLKVGYINHLAGLNPDLTWISHKNGVPKGPFGVLYRLRKPQKALSALMVYSSDISISITPQQRKKFFSTLSPNIICDTSLISEDVTATLKSVAPRNIYNFDIKGNFPEEGGKGTIEEPGPHHLRRIMKYPSVMNHVRKYGDLYTECEFYQSVAEEKPYNPGWRKPNPPLGRIGFIQEPGYKLRAVANPHRGIQYLLEPLKQSLLIKLSQSVNDCTLDQEKGWMWAQKGSKPV
jgi:hypothetical protein